MCLRAEYQNKILHWLMVISFQNLSKKKEVLQQQIKLFRTLRGGSFPDFFKKFNENNFQLYKLVSMYNLSHHFSSQSKLVQIVIYKYIENILKAGFKRNKLSIHRNMYHLESRKKFLNTHGILMKGLDMNKNDYHWRQTQNVMKKETAIFPYKIHHI